MLSRRDAIKLAIAGALSPLLSLLPEREVSEQLVTNVMGRARLLPPSKMPRTLAMSGLCDTRRVEPQTEFAPSGEWRFLNRNLYRYEYGYITLAEYQDDLGHKRTYYNQYDKNCKWWSGHFEGWILDAKDLRPLPVQKEAGK